MTRRMIIDASHEEETRIAVVEGNRLLEYEYESKFRKPLKGSIFLAKVTRVEPSLQAAFVNFGGNRHGFLPFSEIHPDYFRIPISDREALLAEQQAVMDEMAQREEQETAESPALQDDNGALPAEISGAPENIEEIADDEDHIEEIGGGTAPSTEAPITEEASFNGFEESENGYNGDLQGEEGQAEYAPAFASDESMDNGAMPMESASGENNGDQPPSEGEQGSHDEGRNGRNGRGGRHRRWRGGRGRRDGGGRNGGGGRGGRSPYNARRVESFGGEEYEESGADRFRYNLRRRYKIQEVIKRGQIMLVQVSKEERGNKGAAVSTYLSLPGRYCVLMPNTPRGGGVSRKIASYQDRARMREIVRELEVPQGMSVILRTAGVARALEEIQRDLDYLMKLWDNIRELTLQSTAPAMVYGEADLIKRAVRDLYTSDIEEIVVQGREGFETARNFMEMLAPGHVDRVRDYDESATPLFRKYKVEEQIAEIGESHVTLPAGGYMIINQTEALVAIDVNSGRATKERHIEETALKTNLEAASEAARQLRLRDLGGLIVIDFIDMEDRRNNAKVERRMRDSLSSDRARIQMGRISSFGLMELSRQRLNPSLTESQFEVCNHCKGFGRIRTADANAIMVLRALEDEGVRGRSGDIIAHVPNDVAQYILNNKRKHLTEIEERYGLLILIRVDETVGASSFRIEATGATAPREPDDIDVPDAPAARPIEGEREGRNGGRGRGRRGGRGRGREPRLETEGDGPIGNRFDAEPSGGGADFPLVDEPHDIDTESPDENFGNREMPEGSRSRPGREDRDGRRGGRGRNNNRGNGGGREGGRGEFRGRGGRDGGRNNNNRRDGGFDRNRAEAGNSYAPQPPRSTPSYADEAPVYAAPAVSPVREDIPARDLPISVARVSAPSEKPRVEREIPAAPSEPAHARNFETVNEAPKEKKRGWWSKG